MNNQARCLVFSETALTVNLPPNVPMDKRQALWWCRLLLVCLRPQCRWWSKCQRCCSTVGWSSFLGRSKKIIPSYVTKRRCRLCTSCLLYRQPVSGSLRLFGGFWRSLCCGHLCSVLHFEKFFVKLVCFTSCKLFLLLIHSSWPLVIRWCFWRSPVFFVPAWITFRDDNLSFMLFFSNKVSVLLAQIFLEVSWFAIFTTAIVPFPFFLTIFLCLFLFVEDWKLDLGSVSGWMDNDFPFDI